MLSEKPWRAGAVVRLVCGIFISMNAGSLLMIALHHPAAKGKGVPPLFILVGAALLCLAAALLLTFKRWTLENFTRRAISLNTSHQGNSAPRKIFQRPSLEGQQQRRRQAKQRCAHQDEERRNSFAFCRRMVQSDHQQRPGIHRDEDAAHQPDDSPRPPWFLRQHAQNVL